MNFLDVKICINEGKVCTSLYRKSVDKNNLLHSRSFQNSKIKQAIPKGQYMRAKRICSSPESYTKAKTCLTEWFVGKGYKYNVLNNAINEVETLPRENLLAKRPKNSAKKCNRTKNILCVYIQST
ncbi:hypothetical protein XELAEV_18019229mg [Xenopus laevis]|uniref:Helix-turn-helix domain-containing protein n=1 Tax=Xenopus laevis TaxID=8355 RepID=A0A974DHC3_XENLA|nr:hypothetical protein XELAEV_18019229mg [Xenopus laevis]